MTTDYLRFLLFEVSRSYGLKLTVWPETCPAMRVTWLLEFNVTWSSEPAAAPWPFKLSLDSPEWAEYAPVR